MEVLLLGVDIVLFGVGWGEGARGHELAGGGGDGGGGDHG